MDYYYRQPQYYSVFRCIGGDCSASCCNNWRIVWSYQEYDKLINAPMSDEWRKKIENGFEKDEKKGKLTIKLCDDNRCPFHNRETDLCDIQKDFGAEYLGFVCTTHPRILFKMENILFRSINSSCPAVLKLLTDNVDAVKLETRQARITKNDYKNMIVFSDKPEAIKDSPYLVKRNLIIDFYLNLFHSERPINTSIILGALAAKRISDSNDPNTIDYILNVFTNQIDANIIKSVEEIEPNYITKFKIVNNFMVLFFGEQESGVNISVLHNGENVIQENYERGKEDFDKAFAGRNFFLRNIAENIFLDIFFHLNFTKGTFFDMYTYYTVCIAVIQLFARAIGFASKNIEEDFINAVAHLSRRISHNINGASSLLTIIKNIGLTTPAHLALIIK